MTDTIIHEPTQEIITTAEWAQAKFRTVYNKALLALQDGYAGELAWKPLKNTRSVQANALMWVRLGELSKQVCWHGEYLTAENWKDMVTAALKNQKVVMGIEGGFVALGARTSKMSIKEMNNVITYCEAFGSQQGVKFSADPRHDMDNYGGKPQPAAQDEQ